MDVNSLLIRMLKIDSVSGNERKICDFVYELLKKNGFNPRKIPVDSNGYNIVAKVGNPKFYFSAHLDTVPGKIPVRETSSQIFGRGSCDMKEYINFVKELVPQKYHNKVFYENAKRVYKLKV